LGSAYVEGKTKAVLMAHTLGKPFDLGAVLEFCRKHDLMLSKIIATRRLHLITMPGGPGEKPGSRRFPGIPNDGFQLRAIPVLGRSINQSFIRRITFYMGEGGAVNIVSRPPLKTYGESFR